ncbi:hypothetical protein [Pseudoalteromonas peptidolytica]|uniref:hypothetical protein n=1 Tax=Pseudoalteromonas peptidolytica TaxID=61150 RepID=UPI00116D5D25|nr:hypothetical protein [Pseudoalteromonas peptidolytica]NLR16129.1 hypothetical protein [Pseudoalteromonas peptidolytica]GEK08432.1 hypothetical protein PPE03_06810 [Pseudoalteromonas peptidolytica]
MFRFGASTRYVGMQKRKENYDASFAIPFKTLTMIYTDLTASYFYSDTLRFNLGANNVLDKKLLGNRQWLVRYDRSNLFC